MSSSVSIQEDYRSSQDSPTRPSSDEASSPNDGLLEKIPQLRRRQPFWRPHFRAICVHSIIFLLYLTGTGILFTWNVRLQARLHHSLLYSPANEAVEWGVVEWHAGDGLHEPFVGHPRPELEQAWAGLLGNMNVRLSREDLRAFDREENAIALPDGSGYIGTLNVYHELHCIRWLHKYLYQEHYFPGLDDDKREKNKIHSEHCISTLRKFAMCHGDVGLVTYSWNPDSSKPAANGTAHECVDWDRLAEWSKKRAVDMFKPGFLVHPKLGPAYPDGEPIGH